MITIGTRRTSEGRWEGVVRRGRATLAVCGHNHVNRDESSRLELSAYDCIRRHLFAAFSPKDADKIRFGITEARLAIAAASRATALAPGERREIADTVAAELATHLGRLRVQLGDEPVFGHAGVVELAPRPIPEGPCAACGELVRPDWWAPEPADGRPWRDWRPAVQSDWVASPLCADGSYHHPGPEGINRGVDNTGYRE